MKDIASCDNFHLILINYFLVHTQVELSELCILEKNGDLKKWEVFLP